MQQMEAYNQDDDTCFADQPPEDVFGMTELAPLFVIVFVFIFAGCCVRVCTSDKRIASFCEAEHTLLTRSIEMEESEDDLESM